MVKQRKSLEYNHTILNTHIFNINENKLHFDFILK